MPSDRSTTEDRLRTLLRMYRKGRWHKRCTIQPENKLFPDRRCDLCKRADAELEATK